MPDCDTKDIMTQTAHLKCGQEKKLNNQVNIMNEMYNESSTSNMNQTKSRFTPPKRHISENYEIPN